MFKKFSARIIIFIFLLSIVHLYSQNYSIKELDSITQNLKYVGKYDQAIKFNIHYLKIYYKINDKQGIVASSTNLGNLLTSVSKYSESIKYLNSAKKEIEDLQDPILCSKLYTEYGRSYFLLKLYKQSNQQLAKAIKFSLQVSNKNQREHLLYHNYLWRWSNFNSLQNNDSLLITQGKLLKLPPEPLAYIKIARKYLKEKKRLDSVEYYLKKAIVLYNKRPFPLDHKVLVLISFGEL